MSAVRQEGKSAAAFRTISEVSDELEVQQHVLRFWETKFPQVKPLKRGGGRRYYRPEDVDLLRRIRDLLYREGYTIKGVQKLLKEGGSTAVTRREEVGPAEALAPLGLDSERRRKLAEILQELRAVQSLLRQHRRSGSKQ